MEQFSAVALSRPASSRSTGSKPRSAAGSRAPSARSRPASSAGSRAPSAAPSESYQDSQSNMRSSANVRSEAPQRQVSPVTSRQHHQQQTSQRQGLDWVRDLTFRGQFAPESGDSWWYIQNVTTQTALFPGEQWRFPPDWGEWRAREGMLVQVHPPGGGHVEHQGDDAHERGQGDLREDHHQGARHLLHLYCRSVPQ